MAKHFNGVEGIIYFKHKDDAQKKEFIKLYYGFNRQLLVELQLIQYFLKIPDKIMMS